MKLEKDLNNLGFYIYTSPRKIESIQTHWMNRICNRIIPGFKQKREEKVCALLETFLQTPTLETKTRVRWNKIVKGSQKHLIKHSLFSDTYNQSQARVITTLLSKGVNPEYAITEKVFEDHPDFLQFILKNHLHKKILAFQGEAKDGEFNRKMHMRAVGEDGKLNPHRIIVKENMPYLMVEGKMMAWSSFKEKYLQTDDSLCKITCEKGVMQDGYYTYRGIEKAPNLDGINFLKDEFYKVKERAVVFDRKNPEKWNHEWVFSIKTEGVDLKGRRKGDHSWLQLKSPEGEVFSFGLLRSGGFSYRTVSGNFERLDPSNFFTYQNGSWMETDFKVSEDQWKDIFRELMHIAQQAPPNYHFMQQNCVTMVKDFAEKKVGLKLPVRVKIRKAVMKLGQKDYVPTFLTNFVLWQRGAAKVASSHLTRRKDAKLKAPKSHFKSFFDIFNQEKNLIDSPHLMYVIQKKIKEYRRDLRLQIIELFKGKEEFNELIRLSKLATPPKYLSAAMAQKINEKLELKDLTPSDKVKIRLGL